MEVHFLHSQFMPEVPQCPSDTHRCPSNSPSRRHSSSGSCIRRYMVHSHKWQKTPETGRAGHPAALSGNRNKALRLPPQRQGRMHKFKGKAHSRKRSGNGCPGLFDLLSFWRDGAQVSDVVQHL